MEIKVKNSDDLNKLLDALANEIVDANIFFRLYRDITSSIRENARAFSQSNTFWYFVFISLNESCLLRLCKIYDQENKSLNLFNLLETIKVNIGYFEKEQFRKRLKDNPFVNSLAESDTIPDKKRLEKDIIFARKNNPLIKKLLAWRNNKIAHIGAKITLGYDQILRDNPIDQKEVESLLDKSHEIFNRYSYLFKASTYSRHVVGHDDFKSLLKFLNMGLEKWDENIKNQQDRIKKS